MALPFTAPECFFAVIIVFALIGLQRGWRREVVLLAFAGVALLFFAFLNGGPGLAHFIFVRLPVIFADALGQSAPKVNNEPSPQIGQITALIGFAVLLIIGYLVGNRVMGKAASPGDRILGGFFAVFTGLVVVFFLNNFVSKNQGGSLFTLAVVTPNPSQFIVVFFLIAVVLLVVGLVAANVRKKKS
jgi:peptidoglycan/LPS O-acetylase OafA/YrhL